ncbi:hypothetical protein [Streptomyces sp. NPDC051993]|uniref:hypothetical protein n=1 Tax=Streptomyces sp. NPDC051993 TaxID=3155286 RepID=UPI00343EB5BB
MSSTDYRSWEEREASAAKLRAEAKAISAQSAGEAISLETVKEQAETDRLREQLKRAKIAQQIDEQDRAAREAEKATKEQDREARADSGFVFKRLVRIFAGLSLVASFPAQLAYFLGLHESGQGSGRAWLMAPVPFALELIAWVSVFGTAWARRKGLPLWPFWATTAAVAAFAGRINYLHVSEQYNTIAGWALGALSVAGPAVWEFGEWLDSRAAIDGRDRKQRAMDKAKVKERAAEDTLRAAHEKKRRKTFVDVAARADEILLAYPYGARTVEDAWAEAWLDIKGGSVGMYADVYRNRAEAQRATNEARALADQVALAAELDSFLAETLGRDGDDGNPSAASSPKQPSGAPSEGAGALGGTRKYAIRGRRRERVEKPLEAADLEKVRKLADLLAESGQTISIAKVRTAIGGAENGYLSRLTRAVKAERGEG